MSPLSGLKEDARREKEKAGRRRTTQKGGKERNKVTGATQEMR